jgi:hypothetical protein
MFSKIRFKKLSKRQYKIIGLILLLLTLPLILFTVYQMQNTASRAALPNQLETESGVLSASGVNKQTSTGASGGSYVLFDKSSTTPTSTPSNKTYGPGVIAKNKGNIEVHEAGSDGNGNSVAYRFKAIYGGIPKYLKFQWKSSPCCDYGSGDGGRYRIGIQSVDSSLKPSGSWLEYIDNWTPGIIPTTSIIINLPGTSLLTTGNYYAIVWQNTHQDEINNHGSLNQPYKPNVASPLQPIYPNDENIIYTNGPSSWKINKEHLPAFDLEYTSGKHEGLAAIIGVDSEDFGTNYVGFINNTSKGRWSFNYPFNNNPITANAVNFYLKKISGTSDVTVEVFINGIKKTTGVFTSSSEMSIGQRSWQRAQLSSPVTINPRDYVEVFVITTSSEYELPLMAFRQDSSSTDVHMKSFPYTEGMGENIFRADDGPDGKTQVWSSWYAHTSYGAYFEIQ